MIQLFQKLLGLFTRSISRNKAMRIVSKHAGRPIVGMEVYDRRLAGWLLYNCQDNEPSWYVVVPRETLTLQSSWVVVVSKATGKVLFDGSANDEG